MPNPYDENQNRRSQNPYSGSGNRYQNSYNPQDKNNGQYRKGDAPNQIPWWIIVLLFCIGAWPVAVILIILNSLISNGKLNLGGRYSATDAAAKPAYSDPARRAAYDRDKANPSDAWNPEKQAAADARGGAEKKDGGGAEAVLMILGIIFAAIGALATAGSIGDALSYMASGISFMYAMEDIISGLVFLGGGIGMLFGSGKLRTSRRMRKKIENIVGDADYMYVRDIAAAIPCTQDKCLKYLENCIDKGIFGDDAYIDMRSKCLVVRGKAPERPKAEKPGKPQQKAQGDSKYTDILQQLRRVNDAIPDAGMTDKISRLEKVSAKIFRQAETNPDKLPQMRKFMDYYLPTSLKLLQTYAELDAQGIEGENISESKRRIEQSMDTLVKAFENQLDQLFQADAMDVSADIDVMENMLRADGLAGSDPFALHQPPAAPQPPKE